MKFTQIILKLLELQILESQEVISGRDWVGDKRSDRESLIVIWLKPGVTDVMGRDILHGPVLKPENNGLTFLLERCCEARGGVNLSLASDSIEANGDHRSLAFEAC